jgi:ribose transport system ATP-binding protein
MTTTLNTGTGSAQRIGEPRLEMDHVSKSFASNTVLRDVGLEVLPGEIHALLGQNGSGKSTLIKVLSGLYKPDVGAVIRVDGQDMPQPVSPVRILDLGLTIIHQSLGLIPGHSVTENIRMGKLSRRRFGRFIDWKYERRQAVETLESMQSDIDPDRLVDQLLVGQRATVAIARALQVIVPGTGCVVLDESTQSLSREVLPEFYETIRRLARQGTSIVIVSHRLDEVLALADRVTILRDGEVTAAGISTHEMSESQLSRHILGRQLTSFSRDDLAPTESTTKSRTAQEVNLRGVRGRILDGVDIDIAPGEIVGVTGATESGHEELPYVITGAQPGGSGTVQVGTVKLAIHGLSVENSLATGTVLVPTDRAGQGLAVDERAISNVTLPRVGPKSPRGILRSRWQDDEFTAACEMLSITPADPELLAGSFSGGNQQKLLLAKWLLHDPSFLVLHEPTQAVDVGARADILRAISVAAAQGTAILLSSIEAQDLALICDRVIVLDQGRIVRELHRPFTAEDVLESTG